MATGSVNMERDSVIKCEDCREMNDIHAYTRNVSTIRDSWAQKYGDAMNINAATAAKDEEQVWSLGFRVKRMEAQNPNSCMDLITKAAAT
ncbi:hypothetical protein Tco_0448373 [Tanacetum coccineum]